MVHFDNVAYLDAAKGLAVCFIISITIANCILIYKNIRKGQFLYTPRSLIMISLAIGDIFLAMFALVVDARLIFEIDESYSDTSIIDCSTRKASSTYGSFLIHFVYGLGLAVLAVEFVQRNRNPQPVGNTSSSIIKSVVYSACPWVLGLIIILPLTMADAYTDDDRYDPCSMDVTWPRWQAIYVVSIILPSILAVLACIAVMFIKLPPPSPATVSYHGLTQGVVINSDNTNLTNYVDQPPYPGSKAAAAQSYPVTSTQGSQQYPNNSIPSTALLPTAPANDKPGPHNGDQNFSTLSGQYPVQQYTGQQYPMQQYPAQQYPMQQYLVQQYPAVQYPSPQYTVQYQPPRYPVQQYTPQTNIVYTAPTNIANQQNTTSRIDPVKEKMALLIVAIIYFICVVPLACFTMSTLHNQIFDSDWHVITYVIFSWLSVFRSLITPIMFIIFD